MFYEYVAIFKTSCLVSAPDKLIFDPVKIEIFNGDRTYRIVELLEGQFYEPVVKTIQGHFKDLMLEKDPENKFKYIVVTVRAKENNSTAWGIFHEGVAKAVTVLSIFSSPLIFQDLIFQGAVKGRQDQIFHYSIETVLGKCAIEPGIQDEILNLLGFTALNVDIDKRFSLISKFYRKYLLTKGDDFEEQLIWLWTILEIFPMKEQNSKWWLIADYLSQVTGKEHQFLNQKLRLRKFEQVRAELVHHGKLNLSIVSKDPGDFFRRLEDIVHEVIKTMCGLPYSGSLDKYLNESEA